MLLLQAGSAVIQAALDVLTFVQTEDRRLFTAGQLDDVHRLLMGGAPGAGRTGRVRDQHPLGVSLPRIKSVAPAAIGPPSLGHASEYGPLQM